MVKFYNADAAASSKTTNNDTHSQT